MKTLLSSIMFLVILLATQYASAEEKWYMLWVKDNKCGAPVFEGVDVSPKNMLASFPKCSMDTSGNGIYLMDCTKEPTLKTTFVYTKDLDSCLKARDVVAANTAKDKKREVANDKKTK